MGKSSPPPPPDPKETSSASTTTNVGTTIANAMLNNVNQVTPDGSLSFDQTDTYAWNDPYTGKTYDIPRFTATQTLSPQQQAIQGQNQSAQLNLSTIANNQSGFLKDYLGKPVDTSKVPGLMGSAGQSSTIGGGFNTNFDKNIGGSFTNNVDLAKSYAGADDFSADRQKVEDALWQRGAASRGQADEALRTRLLNSGLREGSAAWNSEMERQGRQVADERIGTMLASGQEQSRLVGLSRDAATFGNDATLAGATFGNNASATAAQFGSGQQQAQNAAGLMGSEFANNANLTNAQFQNQARAQGLQEAYAERAQPINEIIGLMGGSQIQQPNFVGTNNYQIPTTDVAGIQNQAYQNQLGAWSQQQQTSGDILGNLIGGAAYLGKGFIPSDDRIKKDKERLGDVEGPMGLWEFRYKGDDPSQPKHLGLMASEVEKVRPSAVKRDKDGIRHVNYGKALGLMDSVNDDEPARPKRRRSGLMGG